jgi:putative addiction module component (TIGR02574 family)
VAQGEAADLSVEWSFDCGYPEFMTLAAIQRLANELPLAERLELAEHLWNSIPPMRQSLTLAELEARVDEIESGKVKAISAQEFDVELAQLEKEILHKRSPHRG